MSNPSSNVREPTVGQARERDVLSRADNLASAVVRQLSRVKKPTMTTLREIVANDAARHFRMMARMP